MTMVAHRFAPLRLIIRVFRIILTFAHLIRSVEMENLGRLKCAMTVLMMELVARQGARV